MCTTGALVIIPSIFNLLGQQAHWRFSLSGVGVMANFSLRSFMLVSLVDFFVAHP